MSTLISVIITTYNRVKYVENGLRGLANQTLNPTLFEVIVIDNASTDNTHEMVKTTMSFMSNLRYVYEEKPGLVAARNTGLREAKGKYIAYIDDDAVPYKQWAEKIVDSFNTVTPMPGVVGGPTLPVWENEKPKWLISKFEGAVSMVNYGNEKRFLKGREFLVGANMAFSKLLLEEIGGFNEELSRSKYRLLSGDETAAIGMIKKLGYGVYYDPAIAVDHYISSTRLNHSWFIKRYYWGGYSEALMWQILDKPSLSLWIKKFSYYIYGFLRNPKHVFYLMRNSNIDHPEEFWFKCTVHARVGYLMGLFNIFNKSSKSLL